MATTDSHSRPPLAVTMGEPSGIGGEILLKGFTQNAAKLPPLIAIDDPDRLKSLADDLKLGLTIAVIDEPEDAGAVAQGTLPVLALTDPVAAEPGQPDQRNAQSVIESIELAVRFALDGRVSGIVTNPINKAVLFEAGFMYPGHTEFLAHLTKIATPPVMMLAGPSLKVVPITIHQSLSSALADITAERIIEITKITAEGLKSNFGIKNPRIAMAGLNPHAGEDGAMGSEEIDIIAPAIDSLRNEGLPVQGPIPPDALFTPRARQGYDVAMCMYHDQALIPIKALDFDQGVNVTLGLPIIRTSPDHGTAFDIAGQGLADPSSLIAALAMADLMASYDIGTQPGASA